MKIYVATAFVNLTEAQNLMEALRGLGHEITHDWTHERLDPSWTKERQDEYLQTCGAQDFEGVASADVVVLINHTASRDAMTEFGIALGRSIPVFVLYPERRSSVFFHRAAEQGDLADLAMFLSLRAAPRGSPCRCGGQK